MTKLLRVLLSVGVLLSFGCAKDRDLEDYKRDLSEKDAAAYNAVNGQYTGLVKSPAGKIIGALDINLQTRFQTTTNTDGSASIGTPILVLELTFEDTRVMSVTAPDGSFNPRSGVYEATIPLMIHSDSSSTLSKVNVSVVATVGGGVISGTIQAVGYSGYGNSFTATLNGPSIDTLANQADIRANGPSEDVLQVTSFAGQTKFNSGGIVKPVRVVVLQPRLGGDDDFYDLLVPVKNVQVSFNYDASAHIISPNARWDLRSGLLTGQVSVPLTTGSASNPGAGTSTTITFDCTAIETLTGGSLSCTHFTIQAGSSVALTTATLQKIIGPDPVDDTSTANSIDRTFHGTAKGKVDSARYIELYVVYGARSRLQDIYDLYVPNAQKAVQVTYVYADSESIGFTQALWDSATGQLDATTDPALSLPSPGHPLWLPELHCKGFFLDKQRLPFTCIYKSNRSPQMTLTMQPR